MTDGERVRVVVTNRVEKDIPSDVGGGGESDHDHPSTTTSIHARGPNKDRENAVTQT